MHALIDSDSIYKRAFHNFEQLYLPIRSLKDVSSTRKRKCNEVQLKVTNKTPFPSKKWTVKTLSKQMSAPKLEMSSWI